MLNLELRHLRVLCTIADTGSLTKAAGLLGVSQPTLTGQLQRLEPMCGASLFERTRSGAVPTALGDQVIGTARGIIAGADYLQGLFVREAHRAKGVAATSIRVGSVQTRMTAAWTEALRAAFGAVAPASDVGLLPGALLRLVSGGKLDACVVFESDGAPLAWPNNVRHPRHVAARRQCSARRTRTRRSTVVTTP